LNGAPPDWNGEMGIEIRRWFCCRARPLHQNSCGYEEYDIPVGLMHHDLKIKVKMKLQFQD
jgi:hypothetical protein